jgi:hypothetical protein
MLHWYALRNSAPLLGVLPLGVRTHLCVCVCVLGGINLSSTYQLWVIFLPLHSVL